MSLRAWRTSYASVAGTSHVRIGAACQDACRCDVVAADGSEILIASVSDGAGSASHSGHGAQLAVDAFHRAFADAARLQPDLAFLDKAGAERWLAGLQAEIAAVAEEAGLLARDYACTFLGAIVGRGASVFLQIGDGAIVVDAADGHGWVFWPQHGEFANSTFFVTMEEAAEVMEVTRREDPVTELAMFSDGMERLILDMRARTVHSPSLRPILGWLAGSSPAESGRPCPVLAAYLDSANVNRRTDDDKTLVVATRAVPPEPAA